MHWCVYLSPAEKFYLELIVTHKQLIEQEQTRHKAQLSKQSQHMFITRQYQGYSRCDWQNSKNGYKKRAPKVLTSFLPFTDTESQMDMNRR